MQPRPYLPCVLLFSPHHAEEMRQAAVGPHAQERQEALILARQLAVSYTGLILTVDMFPQVRKRRLRVRVRVRVFHSCMRDWREYCSCMRNKHFIFLHAWHCT
jgi:hypothetical protein